MPSKSKLTRIDAFRRAAVACPIPAAVELLGDKWMFLILRGAFNELRHFEEFQAALGIARNILSDRLADLVTNGILERRRDPSDRRKLIYSLTEKGNALLPVIVALRQWGEDWCDTSAGLVLVDRRDGMLISKIHVHAHDGRALGAGELTWVEREEIGLFSDSSGPWKADASDAPGRQN